MAWRSASFTGSPIGITLAMSGFSQDCAFDDGASFGLASTRLVSQTDGLGNHLPDARAVRRRSPRNADVSNAPTVDMRNARARGFAREEPPAVVARKDGE